MGKSRPTPPPVPDPNELINAQTDANRITPVSYTHLTLPTILRV